MTAALECVEDVLKQEYLDEENERPLNKLQFTKIFQQNRNPLNASNKTVENEAI